MIVAAHRLPRSAVVLCSYNGERFLPPALLLDKAARNELF